MNCRDRVIRAVEFEGPDKIPNGCYWLPGAISKYGKKLEDLFREFPKDFHQFVASFSSYVGYLDGINCDSWGCIWKNVNPGVLGRIIKYPLANLKDLDQYIMPDPSGIVDFEQLRKSIEAERHDRYVIGDSENFFERIHWLHGYNRTLIDLVTGNRKLDELVERLFNFKLEFINRWLELDVDAIYFLDDWGTMRSLMINPKLWREYFKPLYRKMFRVVHNAGRHVFFHSDGYIIDIIPDLIEIGVDALNMQVRLLGEDRLGRDFGGKICILADVDRQYLLPFGTPEEIAEHVRKIIQNLSESSGGLVSWGEIGPDVPLSNTRTMLESFNKYGR